MADSETNSNHLVIQAIGLRKKFPGVEALKGVSLGIRAGEIVCVIGPNGAGKTTLLYLLGGCLFASAGHVTVFGLHRWKENFAIRKRSVVLPAQPVFGSSPTPYEYLRFLGQIYGLPKEVFVARMKRLVAEMSLSPHLNKAWSALSPGLAKKAGLIGCFLPEVPLRILDEPFAGGIDPLGMEVLYRWMHEARERDETIVFSTQSLDQAEQLADRIALLHEGAVLAFGSPRELIELARVPAAEPRPLARAFLALTRAQIRD